jgi:hypothetical protein
MAQIIPITSRLDAVNNIIGAIGEAALNTLEGVANVDAINASRILNTWDVFVQDKGWTFNIDDAYPMVPDTFSGKIKWQPSWLRVISSGGTPYRNRGGFVYDREGRTDVFTGRFTASVTEQIPFEEMPLCFRMYITALARKQFNNDFYGDPAIDQACDQIIMMQQQSVQEYELEYGAYNIFQSDSYISTGIGR